MKPTARVVLRELKALGDPAVAAQSMRFFKTGKGQYGEGDSFIGIRVPDLRRQVRRFRGLPLEDALTLLAHPIHEVRMFALLTMVALFEKGDGVSRQRVFDGYMANLHLVNNWDLVDCSAPQVVGGHLLDGDWKVLLELASRRLLWARRVAIVATWAFIRAGRFEPTFAVADALLADKEDLIHKAVGWMLREVGKRDRAALENYLLPRYRAMPRTALRYAIERFDEPIRRRYLQGTVDAS